ncbi:MAG: hypothetical protein HPY71_01460 [Firmicutes bacterium]|nr:hypothetical protein [Bacillota bacterium]
MVMMTGIRTLAVWRSGRSSDKNERAEVKPLPQPRKKKNPLDIFSISRRAEAVKECQGGGKAWEKK